MASENNTKIIIYVSSSALETQRIIHKLVEDLYCANLSVFVNPMKNIVRTQSCNIQFISDVNTLSRIKTEIDIIFGTSRKIVAEFDKYTDRKAALKFKGSILDYILEVEFRRT